MILATSIMSIVTYITVKLFDLSSTDQSLTAIFPKFTLIVVVSFAVYLATQSCI